MPLTFIKEINKNTQLGLWRIEKNMQLEDIYSPVARLNIQNMCITRQSETIAVYNLLHQMTGRYDLSIEHLASGKPYLAVDEQPTEHYISISHTSTSSKTNYNGYASVIISTESQVSVDIEYRSERIIRIAKRFLRKDEMADIKIEDKDNYLTYLLLHWCAKETLFKLYSDEALTFQNMRVKNIGNIKKNGVLTCENLINKEKKEIHYEQNKEFVMTYCIG